MDEAKQRFTAAARAALDGDPRAEAMARDALEELNAARAELRRVDAADHETVRTLATIDGPESER